MDRVARCLVPPGSQSRNKQGRPGGLPPRIQVGSESAAMMKSLDAKLARIHADPQHCKDFILADAKDADMALAIGAPGRSPEAHSGELRYRSLAEFRGIIEAIVEQALVDTMLMAASTSEVLPIHKRIFDNSPVT